jgi:hypothetical protein
MHHEPGTQLTSDKHEDPHATFVPAEVKVAFGALVVCGGPLEVHVVVEALLVEVVPAVVVVVGGAVEWLAVVHLVVVGTFQVDLVVMEIVAVLDAVLGGPVVVVELICTSVAVYFVEDGPDVVPGVVVDVEDVALVVFEGGALVLNVVGGLDVEAHVVVADCLVVGTVV